MLQVVTSSMSLLQHRSLFVHDSARSWFDQMDRRREDVGAAAGQVWVRRGKPKAVYACGRAASALQVSNLIAWRLCLDPTCFPILIEYN